MALEARLQGLTLSELIRAKLFNKFEANASIEGEVYGLL